MAVRTTTRQRETVAQKAEAALSVQRRIDRAGEIAQQVAALDEKILTRTTKLREERMALQDEANGILSGLLEELSAGLAAEAKADVDGHAYRARVSARRLVTEIVDKPRLFEILTKIDPEVALTLMSFRLSDVRNYLTPEERATIMTEERSGARTIKVEPRLAGRPKARGR